MRTPFKLWRENSGLRYIINRKAANANCTAASARFEPAVLKLTGLFCIVIALGGCSVNPVTGKNELSLISTTQEIGMGSEQYAPTQQSQGGPYVRDDAVQSYVSEVGMRLARYSDRPELPYDFVVLNNPTPNAWALPGGKIAVNSGLLLELNNEAELAAVLAHEIVHAAARHGAQQMQQAMLLGAGLQVLNAGLGESGYRNVVLQGAGLGAALVQSRYGRGAEMESDRHGMRYMSLAGYDPKAAVSLQQTFVRLSEGRKSDWINGLFASHPPSAQRVAENRKTASQLTGGELGTQRYQKKVATVLADRQAFESYQQAMTAYGQEKYDAALSKINTAIRQQPAESLFYELKGLALQRTGNPKSANTAFSKAVERNSAFYRHQLLYGMSLKTLKQNKSARSALLASYELLPTGDAAFSLGELAETRGDKPRAIEWYKQVASSKSPLAAKAAERLQALGYVPVQN